MVIITGPYCITFFAQKAYLGYVQVKLGDQDKSWALHKACKTRVEILRSWTQEKKFTYNLEYKRSGENKKIMVDDCYFAWLM